MSMENSNDTIGNRTRDLPTCTAVPQPNALPRAPHAIVITDSSRKQHTPPYRSAHCSLQFITDGTSILTPPQTQIVPELNDLQQAQRH
jgi:hypothetical protein